MTLIRLTHATFATPIWINIDNIAAFRAGTGGGTWLSLIGGKAAFSVKEAAERVAQMIEGAAK
jgi:hypothetical protein